MTFYCFFYGEEGWQIKANGSAVFKTGTFENIVIETAKIENSSFDGSIDMTGFLIIPEYEEFAGLTIQEGFSDNGELLSFYGDLVGLTNVTTTTNTDWISVKRGNKYGDIKFAASLPIPIGLITINYVKFTNGGVYCSPSINARKQGIVYLVENGKGTQRGTLTGNPGLIRKDKIKIPYLPSTDPQKEGVLWRDGNSLKISQEKA